MARWEEFGHAVADALIQSGKRQADVAAALKVNQSTVSDWKNGKTQPTEPQMTFALERFLGLLPGELSKYLGYLPPSAAGPAWRDAIARDPKIDARLRDVLFAVADKLERT